jgi:hypothetical protein
MNSSSASSSATTSRSSPATIRSSWEAIGRTATTRRSSAGSSRGATSSTASRASCITRRPPAWGLASGRTSRDARTEPSSPQPRAVPQERPRPAARFCSICRARRSTAQPRTRPARRTSTTKSSPCSFRTSGRSGRASRSTTACAGSRNSSPTRSCRLRKRLMDVS